MSSVVCISCLVVVSVLGGVTGLPEQQLEMDNHSENKDIVSIILDDHLEMRGGTCGKTKLACRLSGGKCQSKTVICDGDFLTGRQYCRKSNKCGCCVPPTTRTPKGCVFGDTAYPHGDIIKDICMQLVCVDGDWKYIGQTHRHCGECIVHGEPHIALYDSTNPVSDVQTYGETGTYAISQHGFKEQPLFGVSSNFEACHAPGVSCVGSATYVEPGINVTLILPSLSDTDYCNGKDGPVNASTDPLCMIKVLVNDEERMMDNSVKSFSGTDGNVLVFKHNHINSSDDLNCMNVVGSKGFSVSLCQYAHDYAWFYVWAMPSLQNQLNGLCGTYPGIEGSPYTTRSDTQTYNYNVSAESWKVKENPPSNLTLAIGENYDIMLRTSSEDSCADPTVLSQIQDQCNITNKMCPWHTRPFYDSCVYDLCRVGNPDRYLEGYASHALVHRQTSVSSAKCDCKYEWNYWSHGCVISKAAPSEYTACHCTYIYYVVRDAPINICFGTVVHPCKDPSSSNCENPGIDYESCLQGEGNCDGYMFSRI